MVYNKLRERVTAENQERMLSDLQALTMTGDNAHIAENVLSWNLSPLMQKKLKSGELSREKAIEKAVKSIKADYAKRLEKALSKIQAVENAGELAEISISVEWKDSRAWGANPTASVRAIGGGFFHGTGKASGCGYCKLSASVADALNACPNILTVLYSAIENDTTGASNKEILGYGSGYGVLPYFEGGTGISCYQSIFEKLGYTWSNVGSGKKFDAYHVTKGGK